MRSHIRKDLLPKPEDYFSKQGFKFKEGRGDWRTTTCPFHADHSPSLRVRLETGGFICMTCGEKGGGLIDFHMKRHSLGFKETCQELGAWEA